MSDNPTGNLANFPRPANDNGWGVHFVLDPTPTNLDKFIPIMKRMQMHWTCVYGGDEQVTGKAAKRLMDEAGIMSVLRVEARGDLPHSPGTWAGYVRAVLKMGVVPYFQILNEPEDGREGFGTPEKFANAWGPRAQAVVDAGGYAGLQVLSQEYLQAACASMSATVKAKLFFVLHNYGANHPPSYPYPEHTVLEDDTAVLRFLAFGKWFQDALGFVPPMLGGEGGWLFQNDDDKSMPPVHIEPWVSWHGQMYNWFKSGQLSNGDPLPDYLFSVCPWLLNASNWYSDSWVDGLQSTPLQQAAGESTTVFKSTLMDTLAGSVPFVRQFGGTTPPIVPPVIPPVIPPIIPPIIPPTNDVIVCVEPVPWLSMVQGTQARVKQVYVYTGLMAQGRLNVECLVQDKSGQRLNYEKVDWLSMLDNGSIDPSTVAADWTMDGLATFSMANDPGAAFMTHEKPRGPHVAQYLDAQVMGIGIPDHIHFQFFVIFEKE